MVRIHMNRNAKMNKMSYGLTPLIGIMHYRTIFFYHLNSVNCDNYKTG